MNTSLAIAFALMTTAAVPLPANVIASATFGFGDQSGTKATVTTTVLDNYHGDKTREDWIYTITNQSYLSSGCQGCGPLGIMFFGYFPYVDYHVSNLTGVYVRPDPFLLDNFTGFLGICRSGCDVTNAFEAFQPPGLLPGQSGTVEFSVYTPPGWNVEVKTSSAILAAFRPDLSPWPENPINGQIYVPQFTQTPEPGTLLLGLLGSGAIFARWKFQSRRQAAA